MCGVSDYRSSVQLVNLVELIGLEGAGLYRVGGGGRAVYSWSRFLSETKTGFTEEACQDRYEAATEASSSSDSHDRLGTAASAIAVCGVVYRQCCSE